MNLTFLLERLVELGAVAELALESRWLKAGHEQSDGLLRILLTKIATADTFEALEEVGAVHGDSGIGIGVFMGMEKSARTFSIATWSIEPLSVRLTSDST